MTDFKIWLEDFIDKCDGISVYFINDANEIYNSDIDSKVLDRYRTGLCNELCLKYTKNDKFSSPNLSNYDERKNALYKYDFPASDMPLEFKLTQTVLDFKATKIIPIYQTKNKKLSNVKSVIIQLKSSSLVQSIALYQHVAPVSLLGSDKGLLNITTHKTRLVELESDVLKLNAKFVFLQHNDFYYIENVHTLETRLHFKDAIHKRAQSYSEEIKNLGLIEDMKKFNERIEKDTSFARKVVKAFKNSIVIKEKISNEDIIIFSQSKKYYSDFLKPTDDGLSFKLESVAKCNKFLELLDDDFLKSELTHRNYLARSKDLLQSA